MNKLTKALACSLSGTSLMTLSSAIMSSTIGQEFREPAQLGKLMKRLAPFISKSLCNGLGWGAHYAMGTAFSLVYTYLWRNNFLKPDGKNAAFLGLVSGVAGSLIWKATFKVHPLTPFMNYRRFYLQRVPAHVLFAIGVALAYHFVKDKGRKPAKHNHS
ncbi:hypothetical protein [Pedobacter agri]|uniref:hypothetical protein n=1 Tax=Pedobacter agri TaxID=454586 RepID=UPI002930DD15|nr:hypothetical protein [Pedobacter agri]